MPTDEGDALWAAALEASAAVPGRPYLEIGSYCGKSSIWLGAAARANDVVLFALDHHRGSEENQAG
ncbi:MAG: class I SAM-dependent methyltransferase, partial [Acidimicrobiales bacterium]|nr:class I SAM-dependent methyltransferase [Acidimicrobiales bacterium]